MATKIKALRQFSHYHLGTVDAEEVRSVRDDIAEALVGMELAEVVEEPKEEKKPKGSK
ncbi:hypothetical protein thsps21_13180 [Pseudomonas sp. No.21]|uniref:hypothetical protein n=1 Tax=Pseudomonas tohonis TaxID=2725477 RepID=UPI001F3C4166|nr:hypothetical protein [Pseudomonas tohonis]GJN44894.1 hypothetical protein TUM20249_08800 [Pseudomonas tohonis]